MLVSSTPLISSCGALGPVARPVRSTRKHACMHSYIHKRKSLTTHTTLSGPAFETHSCEDVQIRVLCSTAYDNAVAPLHIYCFNRNLRGSAPHPLRSLLEPLHRCHAVARQGSSS